MEMEPLTLSPISSRIANIIPQEVHNFEFPGIDNPKPKSPFIEANTESVSLSHLKEKSVLPELLLNDGHINTVAKDYYQDESFCRNANGDISLWEFYNLLTGSNKTSYIDTFLVKRSDFLY